MCTECTDGMPFCRRLSFSLIYPLHTYTLNDKDGVFFKGFTIDHSLIIGIKPKILKYSVSKLDILDVLWRYDFNISSAVTAPLPQFTLQFSAYIIILYMLETLKVSHLINWVVTIDQIRHQTLNVVFTGVYRLEIPSVMFSSPLAN